MVIARVLMKEVCLVTKCVVDIICVRFTGHVGNYVAVCMYAGGIVSASSFTI